MISTVFSLPPCRPSPRDLLWYGLKQFFLLLRMAFFKQPGSYLCVSSRSSLLGFPLILWWSFLSGKWMGSQSYDLATPPIGLSIGEQLPFGHNNIALHYGTYRFIVGLFSGQAIQTYFELEPPRKCIRSQESRVPRLATWLLQAEDIPSPSLSACAIQESTH